MIRHIVALRYKEGFSKEENEAHAQKIKTLLEELQHAIPGIQEFTVHINLLSSSTMGIVFDSIFESKEALDAYQIHPDHTRIAEYVRSVMRDRTCIDFPLPVNQNEAPALF